MIFLIWIALSLLVGVIGYNKPIGFTWAVIASLLTSPLIGLIITLLYKGRNKSESTGNSKYAVWAVIVALIDLSLFVLARMAE